MISILHDDPWFLVVDKPIDLLTQAPPGIPSVQARLVEQLANEMPRTPFIGIPHRLDRMTSGALVVARNQRALRRLCDQFAARTVGKSYAAWVEGTIEVPGTWSDSMRKIPDQPRAELASPEIPSARTAQLHYEPIAHSEFLPGRAATLLSIRLDTGRMHQIRLQAASRGHPVVGDALYGATPIDEADALPTREPRFGLHARQLDFFHPKTGERLSVQAPLPDEIPWICPELLAAAPNSWRSGS